MTRQTQNALHIRQRAKSARTPVGPQFRALFVVDLERFQSHARVSASTSILAGSEGSVYQSVTYWQTWTNDTAQLGGCPWRVSANKAKKVRLYIAARSRDIIILCSFVTTNWVTPAQTPRQSAATCVWTTLIVRYASRGRSANVNPRTIPSSCDGFSTRVGNRSTRSAIAGGWSVDSQPRREYARCFLRFAWSFDTISPDIIGMEIPRDFWRGI